jgi:DSF synthase
MREGGEDRWRKRRALGEARRRCFAMPREELHYVVDLWVECVKALTDHDLRHMDRLVTAQRRLSRARHKPARGDARAEQAVGSYETIMND